MFDGTLDLSQLFFISDVAESVKNEIKNIEYNVAIAEKILPLEEEPDIDLSLNCRKPYQCAFWSYCAKHIPEKSVFNIYRLWFSKKIEYYKIPSKYEWIDNIPKTESGKKERLKI